MAGSKAHREIWPELAHWLSERSGERRLAVAPDPRSTTPYPTSQAA
jgi:hypothetical protein